MSGRFNFAPASRDETRVFGAERPGRRSMAPIPDSEVAEWIAYMQDQGIKRVCCLLDDQLSYYASDLLAGYRRAFGENALCWAPIEDFTYAEEALLTETILPFLAASVGRQEPVVVHCSGGIGRTGHVLAAWLVYGHGMSNEEAINAVKAQGRNPHEAAGSGTGSKAELDRLLDASRAASTRNSI